MKRTLVISKCIPALPGVCMAILIAPGTLPASQPLPFNQAAVKQSTAPAALGPNAATPYFNVRFALPVPPSDDEHVNGHLVGIDPDVHDYNHSPAFEIMPNGDVLFIPYSGLAHREGGKYLHLIQARLRHGAEHFDMPEVVSVQGVKMQDLKTSDGEPALHGPPLLWRDGSTVWLFTGFQWGWGKDYPYRFRVFKSTDNGASWNIVALEPEFSSSDSDPQPITNAFRSPNGDMFVACDGKLGAKSSLLWRSPDNGLTWFDQGGRTNSRHSTIVPLDTKGTLLSLGGKDTSMHPDGKKVIVDGAAKGGGYMPMNISTDWGKTWGAPKKSPFPWLGANQRPSAIRLANGNLVMVGDSRHSKTPNLPHQWAHGESPYVALSTDNGKSWTIKALPVALKHVKYAHKTLGYTTVRQGPNGVIHVLATRTHPCLHYEFNEKWITTPSAGDIAPETTGGKVQSYSEKHPDGTAKATWSARITPGGRYLLDGPQIHYHPDGRKMLEVTWKNGRRSGDENLWSPDGTRIWNWTHDLANHVSTWTRWWPNGQKRLESQWDTYPAARNLPSRRFHGMVAHGTARHWNESGKEVGTYTFHNGVRTSPRGNHTETFAASPSGWTGNGNNADGNSFGRSSDTKWCENDNKAWYGTPGEVGGEIARSKAFRYYADTSIGTKKRTDTLHMAGSWMLKDANFSGAFRIGYFNTADPQNNFIGIEIREPAGTALDPTIQDSGKLFRAWLSVKGTTGGTTTSKGPIEPHMVGSGKFDLIWKGKPDGSGTLSGTLTGLPISITVAAGSGSFDAFGILAGGDDSDDPTKKTAACWFDDLIYDKGAVTTRNNIKQKQ